MEDWTYLCGTKDDLEADIIQGFLKEQGIPTIKHYQEFAQVMKVYSGSGAVDIYVQLADREMAEQLLNRTDKQQNIEINLDINHLEKIEPAGEGLSSPAGMTMNLSSDLKVRTMAGIIITVLVVLLLFLGLLVRNDFFMIQ